MHLLTGTVFNQIMKIKSLKNHNLKKNGSLSMEFEYNETWALLTDGKTYRVPSAATNRT